MAVGFPLSIDALRRRGVSGDPGRTRAGLPSIADLRRAWSLHLYRPVALGLTLVLGVAAAVVLATVLHGSSSRGLIGWDANLYADVGRMWLTTGEAYYPKQLTAYGPEGFVNLYPPFALYLFVPLALSPLRILWWVIPLGITTAVIVHHRPAPWTWPVMTLATMTVPFAAMIAHGNSTMWVMAALALATLHPAMAWLVAWKPPVLLLGALFAPSRSWWRGIPLVVLAAVPLGGLWLDWFKSLEHYEGDSILYGINYWPVLLIPVVAWIGRKRADTDAAQRDRLPRTRPLAG